MTTDEHIQAAQAEASALETGHVGHGGLVQSGTPENGQTPEPYETRRQWEQVAATGREMDAYHARFVCRSAALQLDAERRAAEWRAAEREADEPEAE